MAVPHCPLPHCPLATGNTHTNFSVFSTKGGLKLKPQKLIDISIIYCTLYVWSKYITIPNNFMSCSTLPHHTLQCIVQYPTVPLYSIHCTVTHGTIQSQRVPSCSLWKVVLSLELLILVLPQAETYRQLLSTTTQHTQSY